VASNTSSPTSNEIGRLYPAILEQSVFLDLLPCAAIIYNRSTDQILAANQAFYLLTEVVPKLVIGESLSAIIPEEIDTNPLSGTKRTVSLNHKSGEILNVVLDIHSLNKTNQRVILLFTSEKNSTDIKTYLLEQELLFNNFAQLTKIGTQPDLQSVLNFVITLIENSIHANCIAIYKANAEKPQLQRVANSQNEYVQYLPDYLTAEDLINLQEPLLWKENKKTTSELHRAAQDAGLLYLASVPLGQEGAWFGLLIAAGIEAVPNDDQLKFLSLIGRETANAMEKQIALENSRRTIQKIKQIIKIEHTIIDNLEEGVIILTPDLKIAELNPAAEIILGYASNEVFKQPIDSVLIGTKTLSSAFNTALQGIKTLVSNDLRLHNRTGKSFPAQVMTVPVMAGTRLISIIILLRDTSQTEQIRARTQQLEQRAFLGEVTAIFAHEVKNPINSIMTGLQFIGMNMPKDAPHYELINRLQNDCLRLTHLMDSVLTFSKPVEYHLVPIDLSILLPRILERWNPRMKRLNISPYFEASEKHPQVIGDSRALEQVFVNLISNAVQAMDAKGGSLSVKVQYPEQSLDPPQYEIIISDTGSGIPEDIRGHIFEPFMTTNPKGTGLGLAISKRIVTAHKGNIYVESFPGGTMFHVLLPKATGEKV